MVIDKSTANAIIGREKSAVLVRVNSKNCEQEWRQIIFHELMHIFRAKSEMDEEHFIDIYGSVANPADPAGNRMTSGQQPHLIRPLFASIRPAGRHLKTSIKVPQEKVKGKSNLRGGWIVARREP